MANEKGPTMAEKFEVVFRALNQEPDFNYGVIQIPDGPRIPVRLDRGVVNFCSEENITSYILQAVKGYGFSFTAKNAKEAMDYWRLFKPPIEEPKIVRMLSDDGLCFHRLLFDPNENMPTPLFDAFLARTTNSEALKIFIGSLFVDEADRQQYVWLYGQGLNGKGTLLRFLDKCLGPAYFSTEPPTRDDKFWNYSLLGKRLVAFPDINNSRFPASQKFKMLSGDDKVPIEPKGKQAYNAKLSCKFIFASNERPDISSQKSDMRRAIFCEIGEISKVEIGYETKLWAEAPGIVGKCIKAYTEKCGEHGPIPTDTEGLDTLVEERSAFYELIIEKSFKIDKRKTVIKENKTVPIIDADKEKMKNIDFIDHLNSWKLQKESIREFKKYLESVHGVKYKQFKTGKKDKEGNYVVDRQWIGISKSMPSEMNMNREEPKKDADK